MEAFGEISDRTAVIKSVLDGYPASNAILRELLQNSDDAGSRKQTFILDERYFGTDKLLIPGLKCCQGPALIAVNDSIFRPRDWVAIRTIHSSSKLSDATAAGKFGLGFRSSYHVTDFPQILSGTTLVAFDPHETVIKDGGFKRSGFLPAEPEWRDQLQPFCSVVHGDAKEYDGTVIRLPLRTGSSPKRISSFIPTVEWVKELFKTFVEQELDVELLFLKNVERIEIVHISAAGIRTELASSFITWAAASDRVDRALGAEPGPRFRTCRFTVESRKLGKPLSARAWRIADWVAPDAETRSAIRRIVGDLSNDDLKKDKLFPHAACAFPLNDSASESDCGRLFTLLPLPIYTKFPVHCHAVFALTPTRQALKNSQEVGLSGRDQLLVAWNQVMFESVIASAWARLIDVVLREDGIADVYALWPGPHARQEAYWEKMASSILRVVLKDSMHVWPVHGAVTSKFVALSSCLVAAPGTESAVLGALATIGIDVILPPPFLFALLPKGFEILTPDSAHRRLMKEPPNVIEKLDEGQKSCLGDYLVSTGKVDCLIGLNLVPLHAGGYACLQLSANTPDCLVLCDKDERELFGKCSRLLAATDLMGPRLRQCLLRKDVQETCNVVSLSASLAHAFVAELTCSISPALEESNAMPDMLPWALRFWAWASEWSGSSELFRLVRDIHLLPTHRQTFRKLSDGVIFCDQKVMAGSSGRVLQILRVPFLHSDASKYAPVLQRIACTRNVRDVRFILGRIELSQLTKLSQEHCTALKRHLVASLAGTTSAIDDPSLRQKLAALPIFDIVCTRILKDDIVRKVVTMGPALGSVVFVRPDVQVIPEIAGTTFIDSGDLAAFKNALGTDVCLDETSLLVTYANCLVQQPSTLVDWMLHRILCRWSDLPPVALAEIQRQPVLPVGGDGRRRRALCNAIDPSSAIAVLFSQADAVFPAGKFGHGSAWGTLLASCGALQSVLSESMVQERMQKFASSGSDARALDLLRLLDRHYGMFSSTRWQFDPDLAFLPHPTQRDRTCSLRTCRDSKDRYLFDQILPVIALPPQPWLQSNSLRAAVAWLEVPFPTIRDQVRCIIACPAAKRSMHSERLMKIIQHLTAKMHSLPLGVLQDLEEVTKDAQWIPVSKTVLCSTAHATRDVELGPFRRVPTSLRERDNSFSFLRRMGCAERPTFAALVSELRTITIDSATLALQILKEIVEYHPSLDAELRAQITIPDSNGVMRDIDSVYFNNVHGLVGGHSSTVNICHPGLSQEIADALDLRKLTDLFAQGAEIEDDEEEEEYGEDLYDRIRGVLRDYDPAFSFNEFLANANDAMASTFTVLLDETVPSINMALSPELAECQSAPSLIVHNDSSFSKEDFRRIRRFGQGKEFVANHAVGQFGLGALNFWHFCDVAMLVSGSYVLFIDPSKAHIPQRDRRTKLSAARYKITTLRSAAPDHLARLEGLFGFSQSTERYDGTIILLPLRSPLRAKTSVLSQGSPSIVDVHGLITRYFDSARLSLFCTTLRSIRGQRRQADGGAVTDLWSVLVDAPSEPPASGPIRLTLRLQSAEPRNSLETWHMRRAVISRNTIPENMRHLLRKEEFALTLIAAAQATHSTFNGSRIMASVPMPVSTSLPVHISAPFVIASDRRSLRFEPPDASGNRTPGSAFNFYILGSLVPPVYFDFLEQLAPTLTPHAASRLWDYWPRFSKDDVTQTVARAFYSHLPASTQRVLPTAASGCFTSARSGTVCLDTSDPSNHESLLFSLQPDDLSCPPSQLQKRDAFTTGLNFVTAEYARRVLLQKADRLEHRIRAHRPSIHPAIERTLTFLLDAKVALNGLKSVPLENGDIGIFGEGTTYYVLSATVISPLCLPPSLFVDNRLTVTLRKRLVEATTNLRLFDASAVRELLSNNLQVLPRETLPIDARRDRLVAQFWDDFVARRIPAAFEDLVDLPLLRTDAQYVSFAFCTSGRALFRPSQLDSNIAELTRDLSTAGVQFLHHSMRDLIPSQYWAGLEFTLANVIVGLRTLGNVLDTFGRVSNKAYFASWIRSNLSESVSGLETLPIWTAWSGGGQVSLVAAEDVYMLPETWSADSSVRALSMFVPSGTFWTAYDPRLARLLPQSRKLSSGQALARIGLPHTVSTSRLVDLTSILHLLRQADISDERALIPDGNRVLRRPQVLFDHRVPLFVAAFSANFDSKFVHPDLRDSIEHLISLGVRNLVNFDTFVEAATAVDSDFADGSMDVSRAEQVFECFLNDLPRTLRRQDFTRWAELRARRFVPRTTGQVQGVTFDTSEYSIDMDAVVTPADVVREEFEAIAWTQLARLPARQQPRQGLLVAFPDFGLPSTSAVINHLVALATEVAVDHSGDSTLFTCLKDTYEWLSKRSAEAAPDLMRLKHLPLFLNIDSRTDAWQFKSASKLVVGLLYDEDNLFRVRDWLLPVKPLLLAAGATPIAQVEFKQISRPTTGSMESARAGILNDMRHEGELADFHFISYTGTVFHAHKALLASASSHLRERFSGRWSSAPSEHLDESDFGIESVLSFLYVGRVERPRLQTNEEAGDVLRELLDLLKLADMWEIDGLKDEVATIIAGELKLVSPTTVHEIAEYAQQYKAETLASHCAEYIEKNRDTLRLLGCES